MKIDYGYGEKEIIVSVLTLTLYEQEFQSDLIQDLFGRVSVEDTDASENEIILLDFSRTNWTAVTRCLWACLKTADPSLPSFKSWASSLGKVNLFDLKEELIPVVMENLFCAGASFSENEEEEEK